MTFPAVRSITSGSNSNSTTPSFNLPTPIAAGDAIIIISAVDNAGILSAVTGFTSISQQDGVAFQFNLLGKVAVGDEAGTSVSGSINAAESTCYISMAIRDWSGDVGDIVAGVIAAGDAGSAQDPNPVTAPWGAADNLFAAVGIGDYWDRSASSFPAGYDGNQTTQLHSDQFGGTQAVNFATKESAAASDDPGAFTIPPTTTDEWAAVAFVIKPSLASVSAGDVTSEAQSNTATLTGTTGSPTALRINGTVCTITNFDAPTKVITYTSPLIQDDPAATLEVDVDSQTLSTTISYANSYPYVLTDHGTPEANSIMEGNQFATLQDVELKVVSDFPGSVVTVDWQSMSDNQQWLTDIETASSVTKVSDGSESVTIGYYITETGETGTFERTVTAGTPADTSPDPFTVPALTNQALNQWVEFAPVTVAGVDAGENIAASVTGTDVEYAVNTGAGYGAFTSTGTNVQLGYDVKARILTADVGSAEKAGTLTIGDQSSNLSATTMAAVPQGVLTLGTPSVTDTTVSVTFTYDKADQTGFEKRLDGGAWEATTSPAQYSGLSPEQAGTIEVRPVNGTGGGTADSVGFTTTATPTGPAITSVSVPTPGTYAPGQNLDFVVNFEAAVDVTGSPELSTSVGQAAYLSGTGTAAITFRYTVQAGDEDSDGVDVSALFLNGGTIKDSGSLDAQLALVGVGDTSGVLVDGVGPSLAVYPLTTTDTAPIVSGSAGDATSLTLVVTGVGTYNPTPSGGSWSQQLPTVALGDYSMTLNGTDALGNAAVEAQSTLSVVAEIVNNTTAVLQPVLKSVLAPIFEDVL